MDKVSFYTEKISALYGPTKAWRFFILAKLYRKSFARWINFIEKSPVSVSEELKTILAMSVAFRFVDPQFSVPERVDTLIYHYTTLANRFSPQALTAFMTGKTYQIVELTGQSGNKYALRLSNKVTKEGAMQIVFIDVDANADLAVLAGIIGEDNVTSVFGIGVLIGPGMRLANARQRVADATRDLGGLTPKQAVVHAAGAVAEWFGIGEVITPGRKKVNLKNWSKRHAIRADYDAFWGGFTKGKAPDGCYRLPTPFPRSLPAVQQEKIDAANIEVKKVLDKVL